MNGIFLLVGIFSSVVLTSCAPRVHKSGSVKVSSFPVSFDAYSKTLAAKSANMNMKISNPNSFLSLLGQGSINFSNQSFETTFKSPLGFFQVMMLNQIEYIHVPSQFAYSTAQNKPWISISTLSNKTNKTNKTLGVAARCKIDAIELFDFMKFCLKIYKKRAKSI